jgi:glycosyltransferase involved in cell wall biosynthesis
MSGADWQSTRGPASARPRLVHVFTVASSLDFVRGQLRHMGDRGFDVHLVAAPDGDSMARFAEGERATPHEVPMTRALTPLTDVGSLFRLWRLLRALSPIVVNAGTPKGGFLGIVAAALSGVPIRIYQMHGIRGMTAQGWRRSLLMGTEWLACHLATRVLCVSASTRDTAIAARICPPEKIVVLGAGSCNGVDARWRFDPDRVDESERLDMRRELELPAGSPVLGFVGRVVREKGIAELASAWELLAAEFPTLHLLIVGPAESEDPVPTATLNALRADARVRFAGNVTDPARYYAVMDLVALPTYREGLPNVPLEAAAMRLPVVATKVPGCVDALIDGVTGTFVPVRSVQPLAEAIATYVRSPDLRREHGQNGRERVLRDFVPEQIWERVFEFYRAELDRLELTVRAGPARKPR